MTMGEEAIISTKSTSAATETDVTSKDSPALKEWSLKQKLQDAGYRGKLLHSLWIAMALFALGATAAQRGQAFLDLQIITKTDVKKASTFFTSRSCGELTGAVLSGLIGYKINRSLLMLLSVILMGVTTITTPHCSVYALMICIQYVAGLSHGMLNTTGNAENMRIWGKDGRVVTQFLHFCAALGCLVSPMITEPFLAERIDMTPRNFSFQTDGYNDSDLAQEIQYYQQDHGFENTSALTTPEPVSIEISPMVDPFSRKTSIHYAFLIVGLITLMAALPFVYLVIQTWADRESVPVSQSEQTGCRKLPLNLHMFMVICMCVFSISYKCIDDDFSGFLMTFLVREFQFLSKSKAASISAVYWGCYAISRFLTIFVSKVLNSVQLLFLCGSLTLVASVSFTVSTTYSAIMPLTLFAGMAGLGVATVFPAGLSWCEAEVVRVTPRVSSSIFVSSAIATMINPLLLAFFMEQLSNMWFCYLLLIQLGILSFIYLFLLSFNRIYVNKSYGPLHRTVAEYEISVTSTEKEQGAKSNQPLQQVV